MVRNPTNGCSTSRASRSTLSQHLDDALVGQTLDEVFGGGGELHRVIALERDPHPVGAGLEFWIGSDLDGRVLD